MIVVFIHHTPCSPYDKRALGSVNRRTNNPLALSTELHFDVSFFSFADEKGFTLHFLTHFFSTAANKTKAVCGKIVILCRKKAGNGTWRRVELIGIMRAYGESLDECYHSEHRLVHKQL